MEEEIAPDRSDTMNHTQTLPHLPSMKRAPSDTTVNDSLYSKSAWERSQSEANLHVDAIDGNNPTSNSSSHSNSGNTRTKVSENARVYWDLPRAVEQGTGHQTNAAGGRVVLETIHQREELKHFSSSSESLTRFQHSSQASSEEIYELPGSESGTPTHSKPHGKARSNSYTRSSCIRSCERLSLSVEGDAENEEEGDGRRTNVGRRVHVVRRLYHSDNDEDSIGNPDENTCNYFCDSDFDDLREQRPNYILHLEKMQSQLIKQINIYKALIVELKGQEPSKVESTKGDQEQPSADQKGEKASDETSQEDDEFASLHMEDVGKLVENATIESLCDALDACYQLLVSAWETPQSGRDFATSMCSLLRTEGLLSLLTCNLATDSTAPQLRLCSARLLSQVRSFEQPPESALHCIANSTASRSVVAANNNVESGTVKPPLTISPE